jgi:protein-tyrosine phosphatase
MKDPTAFELGSVVSSTDPRERRIDAWTAHGNIRIECPFITQVADNLWQGGVENGLVLPEEIKHVVSLYKWEHYTVKHELLSSMTVTMFDAIDQGFEQIDSIARWVNVARHSGPVLVHCQAGLNRSSLVVATALKLSGEVDTGQEAIDLLRARRSAAVLCNPSFERWIRATEA